MREVSNSKLTSGHFNIFPILGFVADHPVMPTPSSASQKGFKIIIDNVVKNVPAKPGWYFWGKFNDMGWWETIYLGKAGYKKTSSLNTRLYDEVREEFIAFWAYVFGREPMIKQHHSIYNGRYNPTRSLRKIGAQFVVWVGADTPISEEEISKQEEILIRQYRPTHNAARWGKNIKNDDLTDEIENVMEKELEKIKNG